MNNSIETICVDDETIKIKNINWELINKLNLYDIVLVKMKEEEIRSGIEEIHQRRPFLISEKHEDREYVGGYYLTGNIANCFFKNERYKGMKIVLNSNIYRLHKNSLLLFQKHIDLPYENIIHIIDHINMDDLTKLKKYRSLLCGQTVISNRQNTLVEIGDLILHDGVCYIIYQVDHTNCYGYGIYKSNCDVGLNTNHHYILFHNQPYFIDYQNYKIFSNNDELCIVDRFNEDVVEIIRENKKIIKSKRKKKSRN